MKNKNVNRIAIAAIALALFYGGMLVYATVFTSTYDIATPAGTDDPSEADDRMREIKSALQERLAVEHRFVLAGTEVSAADTGEHTDITTDSIVNAGTMTNAGTLDVTGDFTVNTNKFTVTASNGNTVIGGTASVGGTLGVTGVTTLSGGLTATTMSGTLTMGSNAIVELEAADAAGEAIRYEQLFNSLSGANESNGEATIGDLEIKWGEFTTSSRPETITFTDLSGIDSAFSNACFQVLANHGDDSGDPSSSVRTYDITTTTFAIWGENAKKFRFIAIGR